MRQVKKLIKALAGGVFICTLLQFTNTSGEPRVVICENYPNCVIPENMIIPSTVTLPPNITFRHNVTASVFRSGPVAQLSEFASVTTLAQNQIAILESPTLHNYMLHDIFGIRHPNGRILSGFDVQTSPWNRAVCLAMEFNQPICRNGISPIVSSPESVKDIQQPMINKKALLQEKEQIKNIGFTESVENYEAMKYKLVLHQPIQEKPKQKQLTQRRSKRRNVYPGDLLLDTLAKLVLQLIQVTERHINFAVWMLIYTVAMVVFSVWRILKRWVLFITFQNIMTEKVWKVVSTGDKEPLDMAVSTDVNICVYSENDMNKTKAKDFILDGATKLIDIDKSNPIEMFKETVNARTSMIMTFDSEKGTSSTIANELAVPIVESTIVEDFVSKNMTLFEVPEEIIQGFMVEEYSVEAAKKVASLGPSTESMAERMDLTITIADKSNYTWPSADIVMEHAKRSINKVTVSEVTPEHTVANPEHDVTGYILEATAPKLIAVVEAIPGKRVSDNTYTCGTPELLGDIDCAISMKKAGLTSQVFSHRRVYFQLPQNENNNSHGIQMGSLKPMKAVIDFVRLVQQETSNHAFSESSSFFKHLNKENLFPVFENHTDFYTRLSDVGSVIIEEPRDLSDAYGVIQAFGPMVEEYHSIMMCVPMILKEMMQRTHDLLSILREVEVWFGVSEFTQRDRELAVNFCLMVVQYKGDVRSVCENFNSHAVPQNIKALLEVKKTALRNILSQLQSLEKTFTMLPTKQAETIIANGMNRLAPVFSNGMKSVERRKMIDANKVLISTIISDMIDLIKNIDIYKENMNELKELGTQIEVNVLAIGKHLQVNDLLVRVAEKFDLEYLSQTIAKYLHLLNNSRSNPNVESCFNFFVESSHKAKQRV